MDTTTRWLSMLGIGTLCSGLSFFVLRIPIRTIFVFFIIGAPLVALSLYVDAKSKQQKKITSKTTATTLSIRFVNLKNRKPVYRKIAPAAL
jgi:hypothetical protein